MNGGIFVDKEITWNETINGILACTTMRETGEALLRFAGMVERSENPGLRLAQFWTALSEYTAHRWTEHPYPLCGRLLCPPKKTPATILRLSISPQGSIDHDLQELKRCGRILSSYRTCAGSCMAEVPFRQILDRLEYVYRMPEVLTDHRRLRILLPPDGPQDKRSEILFRRHFPPAPIGAYLIFYPAAPDCQPDGIVQGPVSEFVYQLARLLTLYTLGADAHACQLPRDIQEQMSHCGLLLQGELDKHLCQALTAAMMLILECREGNVYFYRDFISEVSPGQKEQLHSLLRLVVQRARARENQELATLLPNSSIGGISYE